MGNRLVKQSALGLALVLGTSGTASAFTLGDIEVKSALGERFEAEVPLLTLSGEILSDLEIHLGSKNDYQQLDLFRPIVISTFRYEVIRTSHGHRILVTSIEPVKEPFFNLLLRTVSGRGAHFRNYSVFLDMPASIDEPTEAQSASFGSYGASLPVKGYSSPAAVQGYAVEGNQPVEVVLPSSTAVRPVEEPVHTPPADPLQDAVMREAMTAEPPAQVPSVSRQQRQPSSVRLVSEPPSGKSVFEEARAKGYYGPVRPGETLMGISHKLSKGSPHAATQIAVALWKRNPKQFLRGDINGLMAGVLLQLPDDAEISAHSKAEAWDIIRNAEEYRRTGRLTFRSERSVPKRPAAKMMKSGMPVPEVEEAPPADERQEEPSGFDLRMSIEKDTADEQTPQRQNEQDQESAILASRRDGSSIPTDAAMVAEQNARDSATAAMHAEQLHSLNTQVSSLNRELKSSEKARLRLQSQLAALQKRLDAMDRQGSARQPEEDKSSQWLGYGILGAAAFALVAGLIALAGWLRRRFGKSKNTPPTMGQHLSPNDQPVVSPQSGESRAVERAPMGRSEPAVSLEKPGVSGAAVAAGVAAAAVAGTAAVAMAGDDDDEETAIIPPSEPSVEETLMEGSETALHDDLGVKDTSIDDVTEVGSQKEEASIEPHAADSETESSAHAAPPPKRSLIEEAMGDDFEDDLEIGGTSELDALSGTMDDHDVEETLIESPISASALQEETSKEAVSALNLGAESEEPADSIPELDLGGDEEEPSDGIPDLDLGGDEEEPSDGIPELDLGGDEEEVSDGIPELDLGGDEEEVSDGIPELDLGGD
ncbi:MAG: hypothetical protein HQL50_10635, partial [Magnetococcales bacterium]|nr:hypothetical protein [Magnetococcales bacterium]